MGNSRSNLPLYNPAINMIGEEDEGNFFMQGGDDSHYFMQGDMPLTGNDNKSKSSDLDPLDRTLFFKITNTSGTDQTAILFSAPSTAQPAGVIVSIDQNNIFSPGIDDQDTVRNDVIANAYAIQGMKMIFMCQFETIKNYPTINDIIIVPAIKFNVDNNTMAYDSVHARMYMSEYDTLDAKLSWQDSTNEFFSSFLIIGPLFNTDIVDIAVSTTSNKIYVLTSQGEVHIVDTITNTLITVLVLPTFGNVHRRIEWNSVKNSFYVTVDVDTIFEISAVTDTITATILTPGGSSPFALTFKSSTNDMFVTYFVSNKIAKINCALNTISTIIGATITNSPNAIVYNPRTNLVTYGSDVNPGVRTFNADSLAFSLIVIPAAILDVNIYPLDNKLYLLEINSSNIIIIDGSTLSTVDIISTSPYSFLNRSEIAFNASTDQMFYNLSRPFLNDGEYGIISKGNCSQQKLQPVVVTTTSVTGKKIQYVFQTGMGFSPCNVDNGILDFPTFEAPAVNNDFQIEYNILAGSKVAILFTLKRRLDHSKNLFNANPLEIAHYPRQTGIPLFDIMQEKEANEIMESGFNSSVQYAFCPRETGIPAIDMEIMNKTGC